MARTFMMEEKLCWKVIRKREAGGKLVHTALHIVVVAFGAKVLETGQRSEAGSLELRQGDFTIPVRVHGGKNGIDD
jgi:hypothetical protein